MLEAGQRIGIGPRFLARLWTGGIDRVVDRIDVGLERGQIQAILPDGRTRIVGGRGLGFTAHVRLHKWNALLRLATAGSVGWYQAWQAGEWSSPDPVPLFALFMDNAAALGDAARARGPWRALVRSLHWLNRNTRRKAVRNIHAHYDLGNDFYSAWLDPTLSYSSALFDPPGLSLEQAQRRKIEALAQRLALHPSAQVLEIGCGWGSLAAHLADRYGASVRAISLSDAQLAWARTHHNAGSGSLGFEKCDYRDVRGQFDAIVSVEMVEAVGREYWPAYFDCLAARLKPGGRAAIQFITMRDELFDDYARSADFIQTYIFPGGMLIRESEFRRLAAERSLVWADQHDFGIDYAETLKLWRERFDAALEAGRLAPEFDARFVGLWRFYLMYCEGGFRGGGINVSQVTLIKPD